MVIVFVCNAIPTGEEVEVIENKPDISPPPISIESKPQEIQLTEEEIIEKKYEELICKRSIIKCDSKKEWFLEYKKLIKEYEEWCDPPETVFDVFTEEEVNLICRVVETECYDQNFDSKANVASVVFNRLESGDFGDSITEIITKKKQFVYGREKITEDTILAVQYAFEIEDTTDGCVGFRSKKHPKEWYNWELQFIDEAGHGFYK